MPPPSLRTTLLGVMFGLIAAGLGGTTVVFTRFIIAQSDPMSLASVRYFIGGAVLLAVMLATRGLPRIAGRDLAAILLMGLLMFTFFPFFFARALEDTTAARGAIIFGSVPLGTVLLAAVFRVERLTWLKSIAVLLGFAGAALALIERVDTVAPHALRGDMIMVLGMLSASAFNVFSTKYFRRYGSMPVNVYSMLVGSAALFLVALVFAEPLTGSLNFGLEGWGVLVWLAVPGAALMMLCWGQALTMITPTQAAVTVGMNPLTAIVLAAWFLDEPAGLNVAAGFVLIVVAIVLANYRRSGGAG